MQHKKPLTRSRPRSWARRVLAIAGMVAGVSTVADIQATPSTFTFPAPNPGWVVARIGGQPITDIEGDAAGARDMVGDATHPALYVASDANHFYMRLRLDVDPRQNATNIGPFGWGCVINTDSDPTTYEFSTIVDGVNNPDTIYFYKNTATTTPNSVADPPDTPAVWTIGSPLTPAVGHAEVVQITPGAFGNNANIDDDWFMDWALELAPLVAAGFNPANPAQYYCGSANNGTNIGTDCTGTPPGGNGCLPLNTQYTDPIACGPLGCSICGDNQKGPAEGCDDGNLVNGDGCNSTCLIELTFPCTAGANSACASGFCDPAGNICACDATADCPAGKLCATTPNPNQCVNPGCGNTIVEATEGCDDGNTTNNDGCNSTCKVELGFPCLSSGVCQSGFCDPAGNICACDADADCPSGKLCSLLPNPNICVNPGCGNLIVEPTEGCDDGNTMSGDGCNSTCFKEIGEACLASMQCASGFCDTANNTCACDMDVDCPSGQQCNLTPNPNQCVPMGCGNGIINAGEGCDDGNLNNGDGCNAQCLKELGQTCMTGPVCASGFCDPMGNICACDQDVDCPGVKLCNTTPNPNICVDPGCGNGVVEITEACDDGNTMAGDGCNAVCLRELGQACTSAGQCASSYCDPTNNQCACDDSADCPSGKLCNTVNNPNLCVDPGCGNNVLEASEACEDGNTVNGDGCNSMCLREIGQPCAINTQCASSFCDVTNNTCACDDNADCSGGNVCNTVANPNLCVAPGCGNFVLEAGEGCDDGNTMSGDGCNAACLKEIGQVCVGSMQCASGFCDIADNTCACDMNADCSGGQLCNVVANPNVCVNPGCGNFVLEAGEGCDDGNTTPGDGCNAVCLKELGESCAMGTQCASAFCDPAGNICACDADADCPSGQQCNVALNPNQCVPMGCGNGIINPPEGCDDNNLNNGDGCNAQCLIELTFACMNSGQCASGFCDTNNTCACDQDADCPGVQLCNTVANPNTCVNPGCGNNVLEASEGCDDGNTTNGDGCTSLCLKEIGQPCMLSGQCASGFCDPANSQCACNDNADCSGVQLCNTVVDPNVCVNPGCGNFVLEMGEGCDDGNMTNGDGCTSMCLKEIGQGCTLSNTCASGFCDPANDTCACDQNGDCSGGQLCNVVADPNVCVNPGCGNFVLEATEGCDDGNTASGDGCNGMCLKEIGQTCAASMQCASGFCDTADNTCACDMNSDCSGGQVCNTVAAPNVCVDPGCGNFVLEAGEGCDDGNTTNGDGCNNACLREIGQPCTLANTCASGFCDPTGNTCACDADADCAVGQECKTMLDPNQCVPLGCGNGIVSGTEGCDDGNLMNGDGCSAQCLLELGEPCTTFGSCESGFCDPAGNICACDADVDCPNGQLCNTALMPNLCVNPGCGNGVLEVSEGCDDGNTMPGDGCNTTCLIELGKPCTLSGNCASGACNSMDGTCECDDDADCPMGDVCDLTPNPNACIPAGCGNGVLETGESCDDGNTTDGDGCSSMCKKELTVPCVDGTECGSGNCDGTTNTCQCDDDADCLTGQVCNTNVDPNACVMAGCGNGVVDAGEGCDDGNMTDGDGCTAMCTKDLGQTCTDGKECGSGNCDGTAKVCVCNVDTDCPKDQICDVKADPHACVPPMGCTSDADCSGGLFCDEPSATCVECTADAECKDRKDKKNLCDEPSFSCVECVVDDDCPNGGKCEAATHVCEAAPIIVEGSGILCTTSTTNDNNVPFALLGLLALGMMRRRRS